MTNIRLHVGDFLPVLLFRIPEQGVKSNFRTFDEGLRVSDSLPHPEVATFKVVHKVSLKNIEKRLG